MIRKLLGRDSAQTKLAEYIFELLHTLNSLKLRLLSQFFEDSGECCFQPLQKQFRQSMAVLRTGLVSERSAIQLCRVFPEGAVLCRVRNGREQRLHGFLSSLISNIQIFLPVFVFHLPEMGIDSANRKHKDTLTKL